MVMVAAVGAADSAESFRAALLRALVARDVRTVQTFFVFPLRVTLPGGQTMSLRDAASLSGLAYKAILTPDTICAVERGQVTDDGQTVTIGKGVAVAKRSDGALKITELKVIGPAAEENREVRATLDLRFKGATRQVAGNLAHDAVDAYIVSLTKGVVLQGRLERFQGLGAIIRVTDAKGQPVDAKADGRRAWSGAIPASGNYRVEVARKAPFCGPPLTYLLTLTAT